jgi:formate/nitrite transporter
MQTVCNIGGNKAKLPLVNSIIMGLLAGAYIGVGGFFAIKVAGNMPVAQWGNMTRLVFAMVFPVGLLSVLVAGADLFTGNCMYMPAAVMNKKTGLGGLTYNWSVSFVSNLIGSVCLAYFLGFMTNIFMDPDGSGFRPLAAYAVNLANGKTHLDFGVAFWRGVGCNWLVCLAVYMSLTASDGVSKAIVMWPPIACFVALGYEHSVANMTFIPLGIFIGQSQAYLATANVPALTADWYGFFVTNLIPVTLGNIVGGMVFVAMFYYRGNGLKAEK